MRTRGPGLRANYLLAPGKVITKVYQFGEIWMDLRSSIPKQISLTDLTCAHGRFRLMSKCDNIKAGLSSKASDFNDPRL